MNIEVDEFLKSKDRNAWITDGIVDVYVRKSFRTIEGNNIHTFDIANIKIEKENQGKGYFKDFILYLESLELNVYVESVYNEDLKSMLIKNGYKKVCLAEPSYFKLTRD